VNGRDDFVTALEAIMASKREELGEPPTPEELLAYRDGLLDAPARDLLEAKLAIYPEAARALADLATFPHIEPGPETPELSDDDITLRWQSFRRRLEELPAPAPLPAPVTVPRSLPWRSPGRLAAAAVLLLVSGLMTGYLTGYRAGRGSTPETAPQPARNVQIAELEPLGEEGFRAPLAPVELPPVSDELLLILTLPSTEQLSGYAAEIHDREGAQRWIVEDLRPTPEGTLRVSFRQGTLAPGDYRIGLFGGDGANRKRLASYALRVLEGAGE